MAGEWLTYQLVGEGEASVLLRRRVDVPLILITLKAAHAAHAVRVLINADHVLSIIQNVDKVTLHMSAGPGTIELPTLSPELAAFLVTTLADCL
jgi:hypothetical protein